MQSRSPKLSKTVSIMFIGRLVDNKNDFKCSWKKCDFLEKMQFLKMHFFSNLGLARLLRNLLYFAGSIGATKSDIFSDQDNQYT